MNRFLRGHRVLTLDREFHAGVRSIWVIYKPSA
jgi:hypothetical protein